MPSAFFHHVHSIEPVEVAPGFYSRMLHMGAATLNFITVAAGNTVPMHQHVHTQQSIVLEGRFSMTVEGETQELVPGMVCTIPSQARHGGTALTDCKLLDIFEPMREEYASLGGIRLAE